MNYLYNGRWVVGSWRNLNRKPVEWDNLDDVMRDTQNMGDILFNLFYPGVFRWRDAGNDWRVACPLNMPEPTPFVKPRSIVHSTPPRKGDFIIFDDVDSLRYAVILWVNNQDQEVCYKRLDTKAVDKCEIDCLESHSAGSSRVRWRLT